MNVLGYVRVSTNKQEGSPEVQAQRLTEWADLAGDWSLELRQEDAASAASLKGRPVLAQALADLKAGRADALAVSKLDRLSRSVADFSRLLSDAEREGWGIICLDLGIDTTTITGRAMAQVTAVFAEMERRRIGERTREAMRVKAATGKHMGRPSRLSAESVARAAFLYRLGLTLTEVAAQLTEEGLPTATGGRWHASTVASALRVAGVETRPRGRRPMEAA